jgi:hypothetical protein
LGALEGSAARRVCPIRPIRISITAEAFAARLFSSLRSTSAAKGLIWLDCSVVNKPRLLRGPGENDSDVIPQLANP